MEPRNSARAALTGPLSAKSSPAAPEPRLRGLSKLNLLRDPGVEPLTGVVARAARTLSPPSSAPTLRNNDPIIQPLHPTAPRPHRQHPQHRRATPPNLNQLVRREIPPPVSRRALQPLLDNQLPIRSNIKLPLPNRRELSKPLPPRQSRPTLARRPSSPHENQPALYLDLQRNEVAIRPAVQQLPIEPITRAHAAHTESRRQNAQHEPKRAHEAAAGKHCETRATPPSRHAPPAPGHHPDPLSDNHRQQESQPHARRPARQPETTAPAQQPTAPRRNKPNAANAAANQTRHPRPGPTA